MPDLDAATLLELERAHPRWTTAKHRAVTAIGLTQTSYSLQLHRALTTPAALEHDPVLVRHLRDRHRNTRQQRAARLGQHPAPEAP